MHVLNTLNNKKHEVVIAPATTAAINDVARSKRFEFNWKKATGELTYKLSLKQTGEILGLMSITDRPDELAIEIKMLESSKENVGKYKTYEHVAGCMIAFACRQAFLKGYDGYVCLVPKTVLKQHYHSIYQMETTGRYMFVDGKKSYDLIRKYIET
jgi:hypothetical protein